MRYISFAIVLLFIISCAPSTPSGILQQDEMEDILYDMHVAQSIYETREGGVATGADLMALRASVLKKYDVDKAQWDSSFNYYSRNSRELYGIYQSLVKRMEANVVALGGKVDGMQGEEADTANVWKAEPSFILMHQAPYNLMTFDVKPDSTFEDGDRITLQWDAQFIFQDGSRDIAAFVAVYYDNDSIATQSSHSNFDGHGIVTINNDVDRLHIKHIKGYFLLVQTLSQNSSDANTSTMRLAAVRNVRLLHLHTAPPASMKGEKPKEQADSLKADSLMKDSIMKSHTTIVN